MEQFCLAHAGLPSDDAQPVAVVVCDAMLVFYSRSSGLSDSGSEHMLSPQASVCTAPIGAVLLSMFVELGWKQEGCESCSVADSVGSQVCLDCTDCSSL